MIYQTKQTVTFKKAILTEVVSGVQVALKIFVEVLAMN